MYVPSWLHRRRRRTAKLNVHSDGRTNSRKRGKQRWPILRTVQFAIYRIHNQQSLHIVLLIQSNRGRAADAEIRRLFRKCNCDARIRKGQRHGYMSGAERMLLLFPTTLPSDLSMIQRKWNNMDAVALIEYKSPDEHWSDSNTFVTLENSVGYSPTSPL